MDMQATASFAIEESRGINKGSSPRHFSAPADLNVPFWPIRRTLNPLETYTSTEFWLAGLKKHTAKSYKTHLRLFCRFYSTAPDILVKLTSEQLKVLLDAYLLYLLKIAVKTAGKPKHGQVSVNSIPHYFTGLHSFFVVEHEKDINWDRYEKKFPGKVANTLRGYYREEIQKLYRAADVFDRPLVLLEYCACVRVGAIGSMQFEHLTPIPELAGFYFLKVYPDSAEEYYYVIVTQEFMNDLEELKATRERWGEKISPKSYIVCPKYGPYSRVRQHGAKPLDEDVIRQRVRRLARKAGVDLTNIQPNHGMRKAGNTAMKNAHVDKDFKEMLMGHSTGLDDTYYDIENPESRKEIVVEYMKAIDTLTINEESRLKKQVSGLKDELRSAAPKDTVYDLVRENQDLKVQMMAMQQTQAEIKELLKHPEKLAAIAKMEQGLG